MKKQVFRKLFTSCMVVFLAVAFLIPTMFTTTAHAAGSNIMGSYERDDLEQADYDALKTQLLVEQELTRWAEERQKEETTEKGKKKIEKTVETMQLLNKKVPEIVSFIKDIENGGDFDTAALMTNIFSSASGVFNCIPGWGPIVGGAIDLFSSVFTAIMGGEEAPSATALLEDNMNQRFDEISNQIAGLEDQIGDLSNQINESTNKIIEEMTVALEIAEAQETLREFYLSSGKDDFSYNQYRNYIYGTTKNNSSATTAYYNLLLHAQFEGASGEEIKYYYDMLYSSLADNRDTFKDYVVGNDTGKSIVQCYYDILVARSDYAAKTGLSAELAAIQFAYDLYQTQILADEIMLVCNNYQYTQMILNCTCKDEDENNVCSCSYDYGTGKIWRSQIEGDDSLDSIYTQVLLREEELIEQFAEDIAYVLNTNRTYTMEAEDETLYALKTETENGITYGKVPLNRTVYLNRIPDSVCELFDIDSKDYAYEGENVTNEDGIFKMKSSQSEVSLTYKGKTVSTICFVDAASSTFSGGSGTIDDPYLISSPSQFNQINDGMDKYYRLISDIDFENACVYPIGRMELSNGSIEYEEFNGIVDGNGHTISNLTIIGDDYAGIFGRIGEDGVVKNLSFDCVRIQMSGYYSAKSSTYSFYAGIIAGDNCGTIRNCHIYSSVLLNDKKSNVNLISETSNEDAERSVYFYVGGIAGRNNGLIQFASVSQADITVDSTHDFGGASTSTNKNMVYAGGVCGYNYGNIKCAIVDESTNVTAKAKSIYNPKTTVNPYVTALAGGITGKNYNDDLNNIQNVYSVATTTGNASLDCQSNWGEHYGNRIQGSNAYVPNFTQDKLDNICTSLDTIKSAFPQVGMLNIICEDKTLFYNVGDESLNFENITLKVNDNLVEYEVLEWYGFDTTNASKSRLITMLLVASIGESKQLLVAEFSIVVVDYVVDITVSGINSEYNKNEALPDKVTVVQHYASGAAYPIPNVDFDVENKADITSKYGTQDIVFMYEGIECIITINVTCPHISSYDFSNGELYEYLQTVEPTCKSIGYDEYECLECGETIRTNYKRITNHKLTEEVSVDATCHSEGVVGRVYCEFCNETFGESVVIPMKPHSIIKTTDTTSSNTPNETGHYCENGEHWLPHNYYVTESYENDGIVYTYICKDCGYKNEQKDTNIITNSERKQPAVVVSDGYALTSDDLVTIYVQLINNPGVYGADFGIRYDERLTLVSWSDGMLFEKIFNQTDGSGKFDDSAQPGSCGYNFVWGIETARDSKGDLICPDGNLLKLVFKLPDDAKSTDKFVVSVVYNQDRESGFTVDTKVCNEQNISTASPQRFITKDGVIQLVDYLPGDVNSDGCVDILDVLYLANNFVNDRTDRLESIKAYGDVNLSGGVPNLTDALILLRSLTGGYGADGNPLYSKYQIVLNTNGYSDVMLAPQFIDLYGENNTYASILDQLEAEMQNREGYKFLGWYTRLEGGDEVIGVNNIRYDSNQKIQTLYAHWEKNSVSFENYDLDYLVNGVITVPSESYLVTFYDPQDKQATNGVGYLVHVFDYWLGSDENKYCEGQALDISDAGIGQLTLTAVWKKWTLSAPTLNIIGYDPDDVQWFIDEATYQSFEYYVENYGYEKFAQKEDKVLYGKWTTPLSYTIEYQLNGGSVGASHPNTVVYDETFTINNPTRVGYTFTGWTITGMDNTEHWHWSSTEEDFVSDKKSSWTDMKEIQFINLHSNSGTVTFTANWIANTYSITYALNGGSFGANHPDSATYDYQFKVDNPTRIGYTFTGWTIIGMDNTEHSYWNSTEERIYSTASSWTNMKETQFINLHSDSGTVIFTATWVVNTYSVTYKYNPSTGVSVTENDKTLKGDFVTDKVLSSVTYGTNYSIGIAKATTYVGYYEFLGWYTESGIQVTDSNGTPKTSISGYTDGKGNWCFTSNITLVAHYKQKSGLESYDYIETSNELKNCVNKNPGGSFILLKDITVSNGNLWNLGTFKGILDGNNKKIIGVSASGTLSTNGYYGMFTTLDGATVKNISFTNVNVDCTNGNNDIYVGALAGKAINNSKIINVSVSGTVSLKAGYGGGSVSGGLVGYALSSRFANCTNNATVYAEKGAASAGGIVGVSDGTSSSNCQYINCKNTGSITAHLMVFLGHARAGGIVGYCRDSYSYFSGCSNTGSRVAWGDAGATYKTGEIYNT